MQHLEPYGGLFPVPQHDAQPNWSGPLVPPSLFLDYVYGVAVFKLWAANDIQQMLRECHEANFIHIPCLQEMPSSSKDETNNDLDHSTDPDSIPLVLDVAAGAIYLGSQNYLALWMMPSDFLCLSEVTPLRPSRQCRSNKRRKQKCVHVRSAREGQKVVGSK